MFASFWSVLAIGAAVMALVGAVYLHYRERLQDAGRTKTVALVRRRRELTERLQELAGDNGSELARLEARRQRDASSSIPVLEAAIARAERQLARERESAAAQTQS
ncbi:Uncharacterised protein [Xylophilus ampelinus]|nr:hypothetical protein [Variovorax sp.]VTY39344.1 Uncharacterised protein [Xylophilus ampelinus]